MIEMLNYKGSWRHQGSNAASCWIHNFSITKPIYSVSRSAVIHAHTRCKPHHCFSDCQRIHNSRRQPAGARLLSEQRLATLDSRLSRHMWQRLRRACIRRHCMMPATAGWIDSVSRYKSLGFTSQFSLTKYILSCTFNGKLSTIG